MSDELDDYEDGVERDDAEAAGINGEPALSDADQISDGSAERDETGSTRRASSTRVPRKATATSTWRRWRRRAPCSTDPERTALLERAIDDPDGGDG